MTDHKSHILTHHKSQILTDYESQILRWGIAQRLPIPNCSSSFALIAGTGRF